MIAYLSIIGGFFLCCVAAYWMWEGASDDIRKMDRVHMDRANRNRVLGRS